jgi:hypothetical protein
MLHKIAEMVESLDHCESLMATGINGEFHHVQFMASDKSGYILDSVEYTDTGVLVWDMYRLSTQWEYCIDDELDDELDDE